MLGILPLLHSVGGGGGSCTDDDVGLSRQYLLDHHGGVLLPVVGTPFRPRTLKWRLTFWVMRLMTKMGNKKKMVRMISGMQGMTPVKLAAQEGRLSMLRVLMETTEGRDSVARRNAQGMTATHFARITFGDVGVLQLVLNALGEGGRAQS